GGGQGPQWALPAPALAAQRVIGLHVVLLMGEASVAEHPVRAWRRCATDLAETRFHPDPAFHEATILPQSPTRLGPLPPSAPVGPFLVHLAGPWYDRWGGVTAMWLPALIWAFLRVGLLAAIRRDRRA